MNKRIFVSTVLVAGLVAVPSVAFARQGADDRSTEVRREDRSDNQEVNRRVQTEDNSNTAKEDNPNSVDANGNDLRGDGTPEDNQPLQAEQMQSSQTSSEVNTAAVTRQQAIDIANGRMPGKELKKVEAENEHGVAVWSVRYEDGSRVDVSQSDGTIQRERNRNR